MTDTQLQAFKKAKPAAIEELNHQIIRIRQMLKNGIKLFSGQDNRNVWPSFCSNNTIQMGGILFQDVAEEKDQCVERLILSRGGDPLLNCQMV